MARVFIPDKTSNWKHHIDDIDGKISKTAAIITNNNRKAPGKDKILLYQVKKNWRSLPTQPHNAD